MELASGTTGVSGSVTQKKVPQEERTAVEASSGFYALLGYFRETNAECTRIRVRLTDAVQGTGSGTPAGDEAASRRAFDEARTVIRNEIADAGRRGAAIDTLRLTDPANHARYARELVQITDAWDDLNLLWPEPAPAEAPKKGLDELVANAKKSVTLVDAVIFLCACQSIPSELDDYLAGKTKVVQGNG